MDSFIKRESKIKPYATKHVLLSQLADLKSRVAVVKLEDKTRFVGLSFVLWKREKCNIRKLRKKIPRCSEKRTLACVASVSWRGSSRKLGQEQKKINDGGGRGERRNIFCFGSNFRAITRLETLATQAKRTHKPPSSRML